MDLVTEMLVEVHRIQVLSMIRRNAYFMVNPSALTTLSGCLRIPVEECWPLIEELIDEGFVAPLPTGLKRYWTPLRLTPIGDGVLEWMRRRTILPTEREAKLSDPLAIIH
jgi:hypothetical protein